MSRAAALLVFLIMRPAAAELPLDHSPLDRPPAVHPHAPNAPKAAAPALPDSLARHWQFAWGPTATIPHGHGGVYFAGVAPRGHGFFADVRIMLSRPPGSEAPVFVPAAQFETETSLALKETFENWFAIDLAYARESGVSFGAGPGMAYVGVGWSHVDVEKRFQNAQGAPTGSFWAIDDRKERGRAHAIGGFIAPFVRVNDIRIGVQAGVEGPPAAATVGLAVLQRGP